MSDPSMPLRRGLIALVLAAILIVAAAYLAAPVAELVQSLGLRTPDPGEETREFLKTFRRLLLIPLAILFFWFARPWKDGSLATYGMKATRHRLSTFAKSYLMTLVVATLVVLALMAGNWLSMEDPLRLGRAFRRASGLVLTGTLIAIVEEWFFRGWLVRRLSIRVRAAWAVVISAMIYAALHAFRPGHLTRNVTHNASGALEALGSWFSQLANFERLGTTFLGLFLLGILLSGVIRRTGTIWAAIGVHAAGVLAVYGHGGFTHRVVREPWMGSKLLYNGVPGLVVLALAAGAVWMGARPRLASPGEQG